MIVVGLDIATVTGVCLGSPGQAPVFWTENLGKARSHDERFSNVLRLAHKLIKEHEVGAIGIEAPIIVPNRDRKSNNELLMGLIACVRGWAATKGIPCQTFEIASIDKHFLGHRIKGRAERKAANLARCRLLGWSPQNEDEADAGAVFDMTCSIHSHAHAVMTTPLMAAGNRRK